VAFFILMIGMSLFLQLYPEEEKAEPVATAQRL
jgi:hypothetical protein